MTAFEQLLSLANILSASEFQELGMMLSCYEASGTYCESKIKSVNVAFTLIKISLNNEYESDEIKREKKVRAGMLGAQKRWGKNDSKNSTDSTDGTAINAISCHSVPYSSSEEREDVSLSPEPPISLEEKEEKEKLSKESEKKKPMTLEERKIAFGKSLEPYTGEGEGKFPRDMVLAFYRYWTEASPGGLKMLWEKQKTFDPKLRLENWKRREDDKKSTQKDYGTGHKQTNHRLETDFSDYDYQSSF